MMMKNLRLLALRPEISSLICTVALMTGALAISPSAGAQMLHRFGQSIQPVYEGFEKNADGGFTLWFGYLNRNYDETPDIPVGQDNFFQVADGVRSPGPVSPELVLGNSGPRDRGQPAFFYPRRQQFVFGVEVPSDFVGKELVWTLRHNGETLTAVGTLEKQNVWSTDEGVWSANRGRGIGGRTEVEYSNAPPTIRTLGIEGQLLTRVGQPLTLQVFASDDGLPGAYKGRRRSDLKPLPNDLPAIGGRTGDNSPKTQSIVNYLAADETGLAVTWIKYRGPGEVYFEAPVVPADPAGAEVLSAARFSRAGTYVLRAYADDGNYTRSTDITVVVN